MKDLNGDSLFSIFEKGDEEVYGDLDHKIDLDNDFLLIGMVIRGIDNYFLLDQLYLNRYRDYYLSVKEKVKLKYFLRLVNYLERVNTLTSNTVNYIKDEFGDYAIIYSFQTLLSFFEEKEMYEDCILIKKYLDLFKESSLSIE